MYVSFGIPFGQYQSCICTRRRGYGLSTILARWEGQVASTRVGGGTGGTYSAPKTSTTVPKTSTTVPKTSTTVPKTSTSTTQKSTTNVTKNYYNTTRVYQSNSLHIYSFPTSSYYYGGYYHPMLTPYWYSPYWYNPWYWGGIHTAPGPTGLADYIAGFVILGIIFLALIVLFIRWLLGHFHRY